MDVLVVDDDPDVRIMLGLVLDDDGLTVREACDGLDALVAIEERVPDVIVLDLMMPNLDGFGVLAAMRERGIGAETRVLILSCKVDESDVARGHELGASDYMTKPFDPTTLATRIHELAAAPT